jgi:histidine ammonia-lyase
MGSIAARHALAVLTNVQRILALELLVAAQALDLRLEGVASQGSAVRPGAGVEQAHRLIRSVVPHLDHDRQQGSDIESATRLVRDGALVDLVG